jgi:hypothetical protein
MSQQPWYAANARDLLQARQRGQKPAGPVVVSLIGGEFGSVASVALYVRQDAPLDRFDWRMLVNLEVWVWADSSVGLGILVELLDRIASIRPKRLCLRFDHAWSQDVDGVTFEQSTHDVDIGTGYHHPAIEDVPETHAFVWEPMALNHTPIERRLAAATARKHRAGTVL